METLINHNREWKELKEYLVVHGDFVLGDPLITDEIIRETEEELVRRKTFVMKDFPTDWIKKFFYKKIDERIIYEESIPEEELAEDVFIDESKDDIIREVITKMVTDIKKRRGYEY